MIDTSQFEMGVYVSEVNVNDKTPAKVAFVNQQGNVVKVNKYRTRKVKEENNQ